MSEIWVYVDHFKGEVLPSTWETFGAGQALGEVTALVFGKDVAHVAQEAFHYGAAKVFVADDDALADFRAESYASVLSKLAQEGSPEAIFFPSTTRARDLAALAAVDLNTGVLVDVIALEKEEDTILATRPIYAGKLLSKVKCSARPQLITLRGRAFAKPVADSSRSGTPVPVEFVIPESEMRTTVTGYAETEGGVSLIDAAVIVSGGRGVSSSPSLSPPADLDDGEQEQWRAQQGFKLVTDLASALNGAVGASRAAVDAGYIPYEHQVGQTGKVVSPDLYFACGISGAIQHLAGMRSSKIIVAINKDPDAPIFKLARYGVVGDLYDFLPPLTEALKTKLGH